MYGTLLKRTWNPWDELGAMERIFDDIIQSGRTQNPADTDYTVKDDVAHVVLALPGVSHKDVEISIEGRALSIQGERKAPEFQEGGTWHRRERWSGKFKRTYTLPFNVEQGKVKASFRDGVLSVELPRAEAEKPKKIAISAK